MCNNALIYNHKETIYYRAAKKLLHTGLRICSHEKIRYLVSVFSFMEDITIDDLGFSLDSFDDIGEGSLRSIDAAPSSNESQDDVGIIGEDETTRDSKKSIRSR